MTHEHLDPPRAEQDEFESARVLLVGADGGRSGQQVLSSAARLAQDLGMTVVVAHIRLLRPAGSAFGLPPQDDPRDLELEVLTQAATILDPLGVPWRLTVAAGDAASQLHSLADACGAELVVVGYPCRLHRGVLSRFLGRGVGHRLLSRETRPVLLVPRPGPTVATRAQRAEGWTS